MDRQVTSALTFPVLLVCLVSATFIASCSTSSAHTPSVNFATADAVGPAPVTEVTLSDSPSPTDMPNILRLIDYLALPPGTMDVHEEFGEILSQLDKSRRGIDAVQTTPAANWPYLVAAPEYRKQVEMQGRLLMRAGQVGVLWIESEEGKLLLETLYDDTQGGLQIIEAHKDLWIDSWAKYEAAGLQLLAAVRFEDSTRFGLYQEMMKTADEAVKGTLMLTVIVETLGERKD